MSVRVCRPKLFKNLCLSLVSVVPPLLFQYYTPDYDRTVQASDAMDTFYVDADERLRCQDIAVQDMTS